MREPTPCGPASDPGLSAIRILHPSPFPEAFHHYQIAMPTAPGVDEQAVVVCLDEDDDRPALSAAAARHWWSADHGQLPCRRASGAQLAQENQAHLDVRSLGLIDPALLDDTGCPLQVVDLDRPHTWVPARRLGKDSGRGWVPYSLAFPRSLDTRPDEPRTHPPFLAGLGAGPTWAMARAQAWESLCVEDALWVWWSDPRAPAPAAVDAPEVQAWARRGLDVRLGTVPCSLGGRVVLACVDDGETAAMGSAYGVGVAARRRAAARALWQLALARALADPNDALHRLAGPALCPWRPDRAYASAAGPSYRRLLDPLAHVQLLLDPEVRDDVRRRARPAVPEKGCAVPAAGPGPVPAPRDCPAAAAPQQHVWEVRLSPVSSRGGQACVRLLVPGASTLPLGAFPPDPQIARAARTRLGLPAVEGETSPYPGW